MKIYNHSRTLVLKLNQIILQLKMNFAIWLLLASEEKERKCKIHKFKKIEIFQEKGKTAKLFIIVIILMPQQLCYRHNITP